MKQNKSYKFLANFQTKKKIVSCLKQCFKTFLVLYLSYHGVLHVICSLYERLKFLQVFFNSTNQLIVIVYS